MSEDELIEKWGYQFSENQDGKTKFKLARIMERWEEHHLEDINNIDWSKAVYTSAKDKIELWCKKYNTKHYKRYGDTIGKGELLLGIKNASITINYIEAISNEVHCNYYEYKKFVFTNFKTPSIITCPEHGDFDQAPACHLSGKGCPKCAPNKISIKKRKTTDYFINKANLMHDNFYSYDKTEYIESRTSVTITCPIHGDPKHYLPCQYNTHTDNFYGYLHAKTLEKNQMIRDLGYNLVYIWGKDFEDFIQEYPQYFEKENDTQIELNTQTNVQFKTDPIQLRLF